ncbi:type ISP restriction/modification enzyme [Glutamicibacter arilaitensis]
MAEPWLRQLVADFGTESKAKLTGNIGQSEAAIRKPLDVLITSIGENLGLKVVAFDEAADTERNVRPDYAVQVNGSVTGYIEVKAPGQELDPEKFKGHNLRQWNRLKDLPNLLYTNGFEWRLWRTGEPVGDPVYFQGQALSKAGRTLLPGNSFEGMITDFLRWEPIQITSVRKLVATIAPLTRLLRGEVLDTLSKEKKAKNAPGGSTSNQLFLGMANEWKSLLFPGSKDDEFADGYAQTVTFALLLAKSEGIDIGAQSLHSTADQLGESHGLMAKALQLLTDEVSKEFRVTLNLLVRTINAVAWDKVRHGVSDMYLHLYEHFLAEYDNALRKKSGSYYTPNEVVQEMTRLTEDVLERKLGKSLKFRDPNVNVIDPAMGTGTFPLQIMERTAEQASAEIGPGAATEAINSIARRLYGFEIQTGPYSVAELRLTDLMKAHRATPPERGMNLFVADTLEDPYAVAKQMSYMTQLIATQRQHANAVKATTNVTVCIGNPPYKNQAEGKGGWVESGASGDQGEGILRDFRAAENGSTEFVIKNLYVYFWRWAFWKVFESTPSPDALFGESGIVCFITPSSFMTGPGFKGMREYIRRNVSEGWIIDCSPEGLRPETNTRIFPGVQHPLAISIFVRHHQNDPEQPAALHYRSVSGLQAEKFQQLADVDIDDDSWLPVREEWQAPFTAAPSTDWDSLPAVSDLMPWVSPGVTSNRNWVFAPTTETLDSRWHALVSTTDPAQKAILFKKSRDSSLEKAKKPLPGSDVELETQKRMQDEIKIQPTTLRIGHRSFDRQYVIADSRLLDMPRPDLWRARIDNQIFAIELHSVPLKSGPGLVFTDLIPSNGYFKGSEGGRTAPLKHPNGELNLAPGLLKALTNSYGLDAEITSIFPYLAAVTSHAGFTRKFQNELNTPGVRVPITKDPGLWLEAVEIGEEVLWLQTYAARMQDRSKGRSGSVLSGEHKVSYLSTVTSLDEEFTYDPLTRVLSFGGGSWGPVLPEVLDYNTGGKKTVNAWFSYRKTNPVGLKTSPLDSISAERWSPEWSQELAELLTVLNKLVVLEEAQSSLLEQIVASDVFSMDDLSQLGVKWPTGKSDRAVQHSIEGSRTDEHIF